MLTFEEENHQYKVDGVNVPSVTQICEVGFKYLYRDFNDPIAMQIAADRGTAVHALCEEYDREGKLTLDVPELYGYIDAYDSFLKDFDMEWKIIEEMFYKPDSGYAGRVDRLGYSKKYECDFLVDIKTSSSISYPQLQLYRAQLYAYSQFDEKLDEYPIILQLKKDGTYKVYKGLGGDWLWESMLNVYKTLNSKSSMKKEEYYYVRAD